MEKQDSTGNSPAQGTDWPQSQVLEQLLARSKQKNCPLHPGLWQDTFGFRGWTRGREKARATRVLPHPCPSYSHVQAVALGPTMV